jgi:hypothetical protein
MSAKLSRTRSINSKRISGLLVVIVVAAIGIYLLVGSHATTPFASLTVDNGTQAGGAAKQACSGATDGNCVVFAGGNNSGGGANMAVGMNAGGWNTGNPGDDDVATAVKYVRIDQDNCSNPVAIAYPVTGAQYTDCPAGGDIVQLIHDGVKVDIDFSGPYNTGGVSALNPTTWANNAVSWYKTYCGTTDSTNCPMIEVLNEPDGSWFWGTGANDQANANAYATLAKTTYTAFHAAYGAKAPAILAAYDNLTWGQEWWNYNSGVLGASSSYVDGVIAHPYGSDSGTTAAQIASSGAGNRQQVTDVHNGSGKPVYVTEVGWPTDDAGPSPTPSNATGDSIQWPVADSAANANHGLDQCDNVYNFIQWARGTGYVNAVYIYGYISGTANNAQYGLELYNSNGTIVKKPGWFALKAAGLDQANPCPSAANNYTQPS